MPDFGNGKEFTEFYNQYKAGVYRFCCRILNRPEDANDVVQDVFIKLYEQGVRFNGESSVKVWLYKSARNKCLNVIRDRSKLTNLGSDDDKTIATDIVSSDYDDSAAMVTRLLDQLAVEYREVLILREWNDLNYEEIAAALETTVPAVKSRLFKARKKAGEIYRKLYGDE